jgi:hypothetical protein
MFEYEIGGKKYFQKPLVLGQVQQLIEFLKGRKLPDDLSPFKVIEFLGDDLSEGVAIVLSEDGRHLKDKDIVSLTAEIKWSIKPETSFEVIRDFFECNPIASMLEKLTGKIREIVKVMFAGLGPLARKATGLEKPSPSSVKETSPKKTTSSGDLPQENASPSLDME